MSHSMEITQTDHVTGGDPPADARRWIRLTVLSVAQLMLILDVTVVNVALPDIGADLHLHRAALTWILTAYTVVFGGLMLLGGRLADVAGSRRMVLTGLAVFTVASFVAGVSPNAAVLLAGRMAQGAGAAMLSPAALSLVTTTFLGAERNRALGVWSALGGLGSAAGVLVGGLLTAGPGWRWVFFVNVPIGVAALALLPVLVPANAHVRSAARVDLPGAALSSAATASAIYGLINAGDHGWAAYSTLLPLALAVALYAALVFAERRVASPLFDVRLLARRQVATGSLLILVATGLLVGGFFLGSFYLQDLRGLSALATGLAFLPVAVGTILGAQTASHLIGQIGGRPVAAAALLVAAAGSATAAVWSGPAALVIGISVAATGLGASFVVAFTSGLAQVEPQHAGMASGLINTFHEVGGAVGVAVLSTVVGGSLATGASGGFHRAFAVSAAVALVAAGLAAVLVPAGRPAVAASPHGH